MMVTGQTGCAWWGANPFVGRRVGIVIVIAIVIVIVIRFENGGR